MKTRAKPALKAKMPSPEAVANPAPSLLTTKQLAEKWQTTPWVICSLVRANKLTYVSVGREFRFRPIDENTYLLKNNSLKASNS